MTPREFTTAWLSLLSSAALVGLASESVLLGTAVFNFGGFLALYLGPRLDG